MKYSGETLNEIIFPLGGIGTGSIGLTGNGSFCDFEIYNRPSKGSRNGYTFFCVLAECEGKKYFKVLNSDLKKDMMGVYSQNIYFGYGFGVNKCTLAGFPHFRNLTFDGKFPIATLTFCEDDFPGEITLTAFNPLIPHDDKNSSIPAAFFDVKCKNTTDKEVKYSVFFSCENHNPKTLNTKVSENGCAFVKFNTDPEIKPSQTEYNDVTIGVFSNEVSAQEYWYRGGWSDPVSTFVHEATKNGKLSDRHYDEPGCYDTATVYSLSTVAPNESCDSHFVFSWNVPNCYNYWNPWKDENGNDVTWKNYYATVFENSFETCKYSLAKFDELLAKTRLFVDSIYGSTLDDVVIDAAISNVSVLHSATVLRLEDGSFYGWEGIGEKVGSCEGTCQHVWNYAYALCFLFPELEKSIRNVELNYEQFEDGGTFFRVQLPLGRPHERWRSCLDGQMGTVMKIYREWKISGDTEWLKSVWDKTKKLLSYAWDERNIDKWDANRDGVLEGRQHHTLDMELFGASSWLESMYIGALEAGYEMADFLGDEIKDLYKKMFENGKKYLNEKLFNGKYFMQNTDITDKSITDAFNCSDVYWNTEANQIKYQIGEGCEIDQMLGQWHTDILGLGKMFDKEKADVALDSLYKNNYKPSVRELINTWRLFALNDEGATIMCEYPDGIEKPVIPITYCEECMCGFEYALGELMIAEGHEKQGLDIIKTIRNRYNGANRNPFNEIEFGSNYARSMASFALIPIYSGFIFDLPRKNIGFDPIKKGDFKSFFSVGKCFGDFAKSKEKSSVTLLDGTITLSSLTLPYLKKVNSVKIDGKPVDFGFENGKVTFDEQEIKKSIVIE